MSYVSFGVYDGTRLIASVEATTETDALEVIQSEMGYKFTGEDLEVKLMIRETDGKDVGNRLNSLFGME